MRVLHDCVNNYGSKLGRIFIGLLFLVSGIGILMGGVQGFAANAIPTIFGPLSLIVAILVLVIKIGGGAGLVFGIRIRESAYALILFTLFTILLVHGPNFFNLDDAMKKQGEMITMLKNLAIIGGLLLVSKNAPGMSCMGSKCMGKKCEGKIEGSKCKGSSCSSKPEENKA